MPKPMHSVNEFFIYYVKGRMFEWTMALGMFFAGIEVLLWEVMTFGAPLLLLDLVGQKWIGTILFFTGWLRISSLMFNGQLLFGKRLGLMIRAICAVIAAAMWAQFAVALIILSYYQGYPSVGLPFWVMFTLSELVTAYTIGAEWKK